MLLRAACCHRRVEQSLTVAVVSRDESVRLVAARAFDSAPRSWSVRLYEDAPEGADVVVYGPDAGAPQGAGVAFDPAHPAGVVDDVARAARRRSSTSTIVVTSASGGAGVTSLALHLAACFGGAGTCFVDLGGNWGAAARLGFEKGEFATWEEADGSEDSILERALPVPGGFRVLLGSGPGPIPPSGPPAQHVPPALVWGDGPALVRAAGAAFERVVVDAAPGAWLQEVVAAAGASLLVVPPTLPGARRAAAFLEAVPDARWAVILNRTGPGGETTTSQIERALGRAVAIRLPLTPALRDAEDDGRLLTSRWSRWSRAVVRLAGAVETA